MFVESGGETGKRERRLNRRIKRVPQKNGGGEKRLRKGTGTAENREEVIRIKGTNRIRRTRIFY